MTIRILAVTAIFAILVGCSSTTVGNNKEGVTATSEGPAFLYSTESLAGKAGNAVRQVCNQGTAPAATNGKPTFLDPILAVLTTAKSIVNLFPTNSVTVASKCPS